MLSGPDAFRGLRFFLKKSEDSDVADLNLWHRSVWTGCQVVVIFSGND